MRSALKRANRVTDCLFCKIVDKRISANIVHEDERVLAFRDIHPQAPVHLLVIPKNHVDTVNDLVEADAELVGHMLLTAQRLARDEGVAESGFRLVMNCNNDGGQTIYHIHMHVLGGRGMHWPPG